MKVLFGAVAPIVGQHDLVNTKGLAAGEPTLAGTVQVLKDRRSL
jgi:hypothetical protein